MDEFYSFFFFSSRRRHTRFKCDCSSDVCSSDLPWRHARRAARRPPRARARRRGPRRGRKSVVWGKSVDLGGRRIIKKKKKKKELDNKCESKKKINEIMKDNKE